jgi:glycosyltransferase involved in cell wall biosynthesis
VAVGISIVIPCRGHAVDLARCLASLYAQQSAAAFEVLVVDSAQDPQVAQAAAAFPSVRLILAATPLLAGAARNLGVRHAASEVIGFVDADCVVQAGWIEAALDTIRQGAVLGGGAIRDLQPWHWFASSDNRLQYADFPTGRPAGASGYFPGANLVVLRSAFDAVQGFDAEAPSGQDVLFTIAVAERWPNRVTFNPKMVVLHRGRDTLKGLWEHQERFGYARSAHRIQVTPGMLWVAQRPGIAWLLVIRRLAYISLRVLQWNPADLPRFAWQLPALVLGLLAWSRGFQRGLQGPSSGGAS